MRFPTLVLSSAVVVSLALGPLAGAQTPSSDSFPNKSIVIYVADFDLEAVHGPSAGGPTSRVAISPPLVPAANSAVISATTGIQTPAIGAAPQANGTVAGGVSASNTPANADAQKADAASAQLVRGDASDKSDAQKSDAQRNDAVKIAAEDSPRVQAAKLVDLASNTLVKVLEQQGYAVRRLRSNAIVPDSGVIIRGVFAQVDENATLRRAVIGGAVSAPEMLLFVGVGNLARPDQTLYAVVSPAPADNVGPGISLSVYVPVGRYELENLPSEELLKKTSGAIAADLTRLLNANPLALDN
jgi:hypothetical protein